MIALQVVREIHRLLEDEAFSQAEVAARLGVSRGTVQAIASGKRSCFKGAPQEEEPGDPLAPPVRCPACGGLVYLPCRLCQTRQEMPSVRPVARGNPSIKPLVLELKESHLRRYEEIRLRHRTPHTECEEYGNTTSHGA